MTVIVATRSAYITGIGMDEANKLLEEYGKAPLTYKNSHRALASVIIAWIGWPFVVAR